MRQGALNRPYWGCASGICAGMLIPQYGLYSVSWYPRLGTTASQADHHRLVVGTVLGTRERTPSSATQSSKFCGGEIMKRQVVPFRERRGLKVWPGGARLAVGFYCAIEAWDEAAMVTSQSPPPLGPGLLPNME